MSWHERAACATHDPETWFPTVPTGNRSRETVESNWAAARSICNGCPVKAQCLASIDRTEEAVGSRSHGMYGGETPDERMARRRARRAVAV